MTASPSKPHLLPILFVRHPSLEVAQSFGLLLVILGWMIFFQPALYSAIEIWAVSEYFTHGFVVLPLSLFMLWLRKDELAGLPMQPQLWVLVPILLTACLSIVALAGRVNLIAHLAAFTFLPLMFWLFFGWRVTLRFWFPLAFLIFAVPVGDQLIPTLQQITAKLSAHLLLKSGIPIYINGLFIEIPNGRFKVAEACSGLRFLIACTVFGAAYGYFTLRSIWLRLLFMVLSILVPIVANSVRVFGTVLVGHYVGMEHASGVDHIVYGWFFYAIVIVCLCFIGEFLRRFDKVHSKQESLVSTEHQDYPVITVKVSVALFSLGLILAVGIFWRSFVFSSEPVVNTEQVFSLPPLGYSQVDSFDDGWQPKMHGFSRRYHARHDSGIDLTGYWYAQDGEGSELIQSANRLYDKRLWTTVRRESVSIDVADLGIVVVNEEIITRENGDRRVCLSWYVVNGRIERASIKVKLAQIMDILKGGSGSAGFFALSSRIGFADQQKTIETVRLAFKEQVKEISGTLPAG